MHVITSLNSCHISAGSSDEGIEIGVLPCILAQYSCHIRGFPDWETFVSDYCEVESVQSSHRVVSKSLYTKDLNVGNQVEIAWNPNRRCLLNYLGNNLFEVIASENAKLKSGDRFLCQRFTMNQPLYVELLTEGGSTELFVMGNKGGLTNVRKHARN
ncbi:MAG: hypothetical protein IJK22_03765 [Bacteroidales bacterium]|nr:hypothetical protein [Bacteroidales bacterium]